MTWAELDLDKALCRNDEAREIPLSDATLSVIALELGSHYAQRHYVRRSLTAVAAHYSPTASSSRIG